MVVVVGRMELVGEVGCCEAAVWHTRSSRHN